MTKTTLNQTDLAASHLNLFLGSASEDSSEAAKAVRDAAGTIVTAVNSMLDYLEEPLKAQFLKVKTDINTMLAGMPMSDAVPAAHESNHVLRNLMGVLATAQSMMSHLTETARSAKQQAAFALNSVTGEVEKAIAAKVTAGEYLDKAAHQTGIDAAVKLARSEWDAGQARVTSRTTLLTTASIPVPAAAILTSEDKDFTPKQEAAKTRAEKLKGFKVEGDNLLTLCWDASQAEFDRTLAMLEANKATAPAAAAARKTATPFVTSSATGAAPRKYGMV